jgi:aldehyde:ferredoxin oxidoreductase
MGGTISDEMSHCGYTAVVIQGGSKMPVALCIDDDDVLFEPVGDFWGRTCSDSFNNLKARFGDWQIMLIGPAGENQCSIAGINGGEGHFAGRTGLGAVMGAKKIKAICFKSKDKKRDSLPGVKKAVRFYLAQLKKSPFYDKFASQGTTYLVAATDKKNAGSAYNKQKTSFDQVEKAAWASEPDLPEKRKGCRLCPIRCKAEIRMDKGRHTGHLYERPDFEPLAVWGGDCGNADGRESVYLHHLCNEYGMDSMDTGHLVAFCMDLYERELLPRDLSKGFNLRWGNIDAMEKLIHTIAKRDTKLGDILSHGISEAAKKIGNGAEKYAYAVKNLSMPAMDPRAYKATALGYAVSSRGSDFTYVYAKPEYTMSPEEGLKRFGSKQASNRFSEEKKGCMVKECIQIAAVVDASGICKIAHLSILLDEQLEVLVKVLKQASGLSMTPDELMQAGNRIINLERCMNFKFGATKEDDMLPERFLTEPLAGSDNCSSTVQLDKMIKEFYECMGWDEEGRVPEKLP